MARRVLRRIAIGVVAALVAVPVLAVAIVNTGWGRAQLLDAIRAATAGGPVRIGIDRLTGPLPVRIGVVGLKLSDRQGEFASFKNIELAWNPWALLTGTLAVDTVSIDNGRVLRAPDVPAEQPTPAPAASEGLSLAFPAPPVAIRLGRLHVAGIGLAPDLVGREATLGADLAAAVTGKAATAKGAITLTSSDSTARLDLDVAVVPADGTLRAEITAREPVNGLVAGLIGLADRPALDVRLDGTGTLADWQGRLSGGFGPGAGVDLTLKVASAADGTRVSADGTADLQRLLPADVAALAGPSVTLGAAARLVPDGGISIERASVQAVAARLDATAAIDPAGIPVAADATVKVPDLTVLSELAGVPLAGSTDARIALTDKGRRAEVKIGGSAIADGTAFANLTINLAATADRPLASLPDSVTWTLDGGVDTPTVPDLDTVALVGPRVSMQASGTAAADGSSAVVDALTVTADAGTLDAKAMLADGRKLTATGTATVPDLGRFAGLAGRPLAGGATLGVEATVLLAPLDVSALVDLTTSGIGLGDPALDGLVGRTPSLSAGLTLDAADRLSLHGLTLQAATVRATGDLGIDLAGGGLDGRIDVSAPDLAAVGKAIAVDMSGQGTAALALGGTLDAPAASASWRFAPLAIPGTALSSVAGTATASGLPDRPAGRLDLQAVAAGETVTLGFDYGLSGDTLRVAGLALDGAGLRGRGDLALDLAGPSASGKIALKSDDLGKAAALAGAPVSSGALDLTVALAARDGQGATLSGSVRDLTLDSGIVVSAVTLAGQGRNLLGKPAGTLRAELGAIRQGDKQLLERGLLTAEADGATARGKLSVSGEAGVPYRVSASASAAFAKAPTRISIDSLDAAVADVPVALEKPTRITLGRQPRFDDLALKIDAGRVAGQGRVDPADLDVAVTVRSLPVAVARLAAADLPVTGTLDADLLVSGPIGDPTARLTVTVPGLRSTDPSLADLPPLKAEAEARIEKRRLTASLDASAGEGVEAKVRAVAGLKAGAPGQPPEPDLAAPLDARVDVEAALGRLASHLPLDRGRVAGQLSAHVSASGTLADPVIGGKASLSDGSVEVPAIGLYLRNVRFDAHGESDRLVVDALQAEAVSGGTLSGSGSMSFDPDKGMPADLKVVAKGLTAVDIDEAKIALDADLGFSGKLPDYRLAGTVTVLPSEIRIPDQLPPSVVDLPVTEVRDGVVISSPEEPAADGGQGRAPVLLDVKVDIPGQVFVRGRGLDSEWGGALAITGRADKPTVKGGLQVQRGSFDGLGRTFSFDRGRVVFDGGPPDDPTLDMVLATKVAEIAAKVVVSGSAQDPSISLTSEPTLPEEEILSRILFGSSRAELSPLQALKLAQSAAVLSGRLGGGGGITDTVRNALGVDTLDVDTGGEGSRGASLSVGKYVYPGVFLKLQQGLGGADSKAVVEVEITKSVTVETDVGSDSQSRVGVNWKLDY